MNTTFKDVGGSRVGFIIGNDIKDASGNRVGFIIGNDIKDSGGNRIGFLNGSDFKDANGNRVGFINGNDIKDSGGNRVGYAEGSASAIEMCAAGLLLLNLGNAFRNSGTSSYSDSTSSASDRRPRTFWDWFGDDNVHWFWKTLVVIGFVFIAFWHFLKAPFVQISSIKNGETSARKEWWGTCIRSLIFGSFLVGMTIAVLDADILFGIAFALLALFFGLLPIILVSIRRIRDTGKPWWWVLIPLVNFVMCGFFPSKY